MVKNSLRCICKVGLHRVFTSLPYCAFTTALRTVADLKFLATPNHQGRVRALLSEDKLLLTLKRAWVFDALTFVFVPVCYVIIKKLVTNLRRCAWEAWW